MEWERTHDLSICDLIDWHISNQVGNTWPSFIEEFGAYNIIYDNLKEAYYDEDTQLWNMGDPEIENEVIRVLDWYR